MEKTVLCFGSGGVEGDDVAFSVCKELQGNIDGVRFIHCETPMEVLDYAGAEDLYILDTVKGLKKVSVLKDIDDFRQRKTVTVHDHDLGMMLKILAEMKKMPPVRIIGIPIGSNATGAVEEVKKLLS